MTGASGNYIELQGTAGVWSIDNVNNLESVQYARVQDSTALTNQITANQSVNVSGNTNWTFSGTVYTWTGASGTSWAVAARPL